ncbi:MAG TPA: DUF1015 domain-containing protein [Nitriliruptorales bacterium]
MVDLAPFRGLRFDPATVPDLGRVTAPPYDAIDADEQRRLHARSPFNVVRLELDARSTDDITPDDRYAQAADVYRSWRRQGALRLDAQAMYVYEQRFEHAGEPRRQIGVLAALALTPWSDGTVLPHEHVFRDPVEDRKRLLQALPVNVSPIFLLTPRTPARVAGMLDGVGQRAADAAFAGPGGVTHRLWVVTDAHLHGLVSGAYADQALLVADGHHRYTAALERHAESPGPGTDRVLAFVVGADRGPAIDPTHRLVRHLPPDALDRIRAEGLRVEWVEAEPGELATAVARSAPGTFGLVTAGGSYVLRADAPALDALTGAAPAPVDRLDVTALQALLVDRLAVPDRMQELRYTPDVEPAHRAVTSGAADGLFLVRPVSFDQFRAASEAGVRMPPKTTTFVPKPRTGLVMRPLDPDGGP